MHVMMLADYKDKDLVVDILTNSFADNKSVNYIVKQDGERLERIRNLMRYSFETCFIFGYVFLSDDKKACALVNLPDKKKTSVKSVLLDIKFIFLSVGLANVKKAIDREAKIKKLQPKEPMNYLWFIGVEPQEQGKGIGSHLLREVIRHAELANRPVALETSTMSNVRWYQKFNFLLYNELDLGYRLFFMIKSEL